MNLILPVLAVEVPGQIELKPPAGSPWEQLGNLEIANIISGVIQLILIVAALIFFFMLVVGGIQWMTAGGDKAATESARGRITSALIGLVIVFAAWAIAQLIGYFFNINIFSFTWPTFY